MTQKKNQQQWTQYHWFENIRIQNGLSIKAQIYIENLLSEWAGKWATLANCAKQIIDWFIAKMVERKKNKIILKSIKLHMPKCAPAHLPNNHSDFVYISNVSVCQHALIKSSERKKQSTLSIKISVVFLSDAGSRVIIKHFYIAHAFTIHTTNICIL